jgi:V/A-type H+-transporting ATPase subunit E
MGLEAVKEEILDSAREHADSILSEARKESNKTAREAEKKIAEMQQKADAGEKKTIESIKRQELASAELENKKMLLEAKKQLIESAFEEAGKKLELLDDKKRESYIKKLLEKAKNDIELGHAYCSKKDAKFLKGLNAEPIDIIGGLVAENKEKIIRVDYSFETLLDSIKESELQSINKILFG